MARRTRKKKSSKVQKYISSGWSRLVSGFMKVFPYAFAGALVFTLSLGVKEVLYADVALNINKVTFSSQDGLSSSQRDSLRDRYVGKNLLTVDLKSISRRLEKDPDVYRAIVTRQIPGQLNVKLELRIPFLVIQTKPNGSYAVISRDGLVLSVSRKKALDYPFVKVYGMKDSKLYKGKEIKFEGMSNVVKFFEAYSQRNFFKYEKIKEVMVDRDGNVSMILEGGPQLKMGQNPSSKILSLAKVEAILQSDDRKKIEYIDLQYKQIVIKKRK